MSYDEIHKGEAPAVNVGVDLTQLAAGMLAGTSGQTNGTGLGGVDNGGERDGLMPAFAVYWDDLTSRYKVRSPAVVAPTGSIAVTDGANGYFPGETIYLNVTESEGTWTAELATEADSEARMSLPIATIAEDGTVDQKHVGAVVIGEGGVTSVKELTGAVDVIGGAGIEVTVDEQTIKISYKEGKEDDEEDDDDDKDPCGHPGGDDDDGTGGVDPDAGQNQGDGGGAGGTGGGGAGGDVDRYDIYGGHGGDGGVSVDGSDDDDDDGTGGHPSGGCTECG